MGKCEALSHVVVVHLILTIFYSNCAKYFLIFSIGENPLQSFDRWKPLQYFNRQKKSSIFFGLLKNHLKIQVDQNKQHVCPSKRICALCLSSFELLFSTTFSIWMIILQVSHTKKHSDKKNLTWLLMNDIQNCQIRKFRKESKKGTLRALLLLLLTLLFLFEEKMTFTSQRG